ncbi:hypothetical protein FH968_07415 [Buttiauxella sp. B2]|uniref:hypothetical protein n=1 Tax=Buttiauxella sp. B2 TaxID=2587812 RepID=UPI00112190CE|nr:hypothetical protein [Buttiauxella sp. B2]TNV21258.1 hypothetical protein FH968_07415 [Buttiauxella sp. B2]
MNEGRAFNQTNTLYMIFFMYWLAILFPQLQFRYDLILEQALTFFLISCCIFSTISFNIRLNIFHFLIISIFIVLLTISLIRNSFSTIIFNDFFELSKPIYLGGFFILSYSVKWGSNEVHVLIKQICLGLGVLCIFGIFESTTTLGNEIGHFLYKDLREGVQYKAVASFISPYVFASILLIPLFIYFIRLFCNASILSICIFAFFLTGLLLTQSRTVFLSLIATVVLFTLYIFCTSHFIFRRKYLLFISFCAIAFIVSIPAIIIFMQNKLEYLYSGLNVVITNILDFHFETFIYSSPSISHRYEQMVFVLENTDVIPLIGAGIGKAFLMPESFYALYLYRVGIIGIAIHLTLLYIAFRKCKKLAIRFAHDKYLHCFFIALQMFLLSLPFSYASSAVTDQVRSGFIFYLLLGMIFKLHKLDAEEKLS